MPAGVVAAVYSATLRAFPIDGDDRDATTIAGIDAAEMTELFAGLTFLSMLMSTLPGAGTENMPGVPPVVVRTPTNRQGR